ncbi:TetR/AcrR family transcriptional regulator [Acidobacteriota bacterium]
METINHRDERKRRRLEENRMFILQAAENIFSRWGYSMATMDAIAAEAQFSKATLYRYFKSKREMFLAIIFDSYDDVHEQIEGISLRPLTAEDKLREYIRFIMSYYKRKENLIHIFFIEKQSLKKIFNIDLDSFPLKTVGHPQIPPVLKTKMESIVKIQETIIREGVDKGEFRQLDVKDAAFVLGAMIRGFHFHGPIQERAYSLEESCEIILDYFLIGVRK